MIPPYPGSNARTRDRIQALQAYQQQPSTSPAVRTPIVGSRRSSSHRGMPPLGPVGSSSDQSSSGFYFVPSGNMGRNFQEAEAPMHGRFHSWEREQLPSFSVNQIDRDPTTWSLLHQAARGSEPGMRSTINFHQRHGSDRMQPQGR